MKLQYNFAWCSQRSPNNPNWFENFLVPLFSSISVLWIPKQPNLKPNFRIYLKSYICLYSSDPYDSYLWDSTYNSSFCLDIQQSYRHVFVKLHQLSGIDGSGSISCILPTQRGVQEGQRGEICLLYNAVLSTTFQTSLTLKPVSHYYSFVLSLPGPSGTTYPYEDIRHSLILFPVSYHSAGAHSPWNVSGGAEQPPPDWTKEHCCYGCNQYLEQETGVTQVLLYLSSPYVDFEVRQELDIHIWRLQANCTCSKNIVYVCIMGLVLIPASYTVCRCVALHQAKPEPAWLQHPGSNGIHCVWS